jgi:arylsulfatase A-like enzyme
MRSDRLRLVSCRAFIALAAACFFATSPSLAADKPRPNVLWICADDLATYACSTYGGKQARTPNIDRLAARGMRFNRAFCNSPVCTASRQSFLTGRYPRTIGVTQLSTPLPESETTLAELLKGAGYETAAIGKMHFNSPLRHGFDLRLDTADFQRVLKERGARPLPEGVAVLPPWRPFRDPASVWLNSEALPFGAVTADMAGTWFTEQAVKLLETRRSASPLKSQGSSPRPQAAGTPFLLMVSFYEPHSPFHFPVEYAGRHRPEEFSVPAVGADDDQQIPAIFRDLSDREKQGIAAAYHTSVEFLDRNVGTLLEALDRTGEADNTLVIFTGDHGYLLGHHGRFEKHCCFEEAIRAPLCVSLPGRIGRAEQCDALVEFIDIAPTILETCGVAIPERVQGRSLAALTSGQSQSHRDAVFIEYSENEEAAIRTDRWKFIYGTSQRERKDGYTTGRPLPGRTIRLYDLKSDPHELTNLADRPEQSDRVTGFTRQLADHLRRTARQPELIPPSEDVHAILDFCLAARDVEAAR